MFRALALTALAAVLAASATTAAAQPGYRWSVNNGERSNLTWGSGEEEDTHQSLSCMPGDARVQFYVAVDARPTGRSARLTISSGSTRMTVTARANSEEMNGGGEVWATVPVRSPVLLAFRRTGRIRFAALGRTVTPGPARPAMVSSFLNTCGIQGGE